MSRFSFLAVSFFLAGVFLGICQTRAQNTLTYTITGSETASLVRFNNAGEKDAPDATWRILLGKREAATFPEAYDFLLTENYNKNVTQNPLFAGLMPFTLEWSGLVSVESAAKNAAAQAVTRNGNSWLIGIFVPNAADVYATPDGTADFWVTGRERVTIWNGRDSSSANAVQIPGQPDGTFYYAPWNGGEPNNSGGEEWILEFQGGGGTWNDHRGDYSPGGYIAEFDLGTNLLEIDPYSNQHQMVLNPADGTYYLLGRTPMTWQTAKTFAEMRTWNGVQGQMAMPTDRVANLLYANPTTGVWTGLTSDEAFGGTYYADGDAGGNRSTDGWVWSGPNGPTTAAGYFPWNGGRPDYGTGDCYVEIQNNFTWYNRNAGDTRLPVVTFDGQTPIAKNFFVEVITSGANLGLFRNNPADFSGYYAALNFADPENTGNNNTSLPGRVPFPGDTPGDDNNFTVRAQTHIYIPEAGTYVFGSRHDDNIQIFFDTGKTPGVIFTGNDATTHTVEVTYAEPGYYNLTLLFQENNGGACLNLIGMKNPEGKSYIHENGSNNAYEAGFLAMVADGAQLVGDTLNGGLVTSMREFGQMLLTDYSGFTVRQVKKNGGGALDSYADMQTVLDTGTELACVTGVDKINYGMSYDGAASDNGYFANDAPFPCGYTEDNFVLQATAKIVVPESGWYTFGTVGDDSFILSIAGAMFDEFWGQAQIGPDGILYGAEDRLNNVNTGGGSIYLTAGLYDLDFRFWENGGGEHTELFWAPGVWAAFNESFQLLGQGTYMQEQGTDVPEPGTWALFLFGAAGVFFISRRKLVKR